MTKTQCPFDIELHREIWGQGYRAAEKDLALTWEDMYKIVLLTSKVSQEFTTDNTYCEVYEEVLKRFNEYKEGKK